MNKTAAIVVLSLLLTISVLLNMILGVGMVALWISGEISNSFMSGNWSHSMSTGTVTNITMVAFPPDTSAGPITGGDTFDVKVQVTNTGSYDQTVFQLDIYPMTGVKIVGTTPQSGSPTDYGDYISYPTNLVVPAGQTVDVLINLEAIHSGFVSGMVDVCINTDSDWDTVSFAFQVDP